MTTTSTHSPSLQFLPLLIWVAACTGLLFGGLEALVPLNTGQGGDLGRTVAPPLPGLKTTESTITDISLGEIKTLGCGNKTVHCDEYCSICDDMYASRTACYREVFSQCHKTFLDTMAQLNNTDWCTWHNVRSPYNTFTLCTENIADCLKLPWPNALVENTFVEIHSTFFRECPTEALRDPPPSIVFALVMTPICLIPVMVVLVVLKTKNGDGRS